MKRYLLPLGRALLAQVGFLLLMLAIALPVGNYMRAPGPDTPWFAWGTAWFFHIAEALLGLALFRYLDRRPWAELRLGFDRQARTATLVGIILTVLMFGGFIGLTQGAGLATWHWSAAFDLKSAICWAILYLLVGPAEEFLHRGYVLNTLSPYGAQGAAIVSSIIFALMHTVGGRTNPLELLSICAHGYFYALLTQRSKSIWPAVIIHSVYDTLSALIWANMANISALAFDGDLTTVKFIYKAAMIIPYFAMLLYLYRGSRSGAQTRVA